MPKKSVSNPTRKLSQDLIAPKISSLGYYKCAEEEVGRGRGRG